MNTEKVERCPICLQAAFKPLLKTKDFFFSLEEFQLVQCFHCSLVITNPRPTKSTIGKYYQSENYISHSDTSSGIQDKIYQTVRKYTIQKKIQQIETYQKSGNILDIGCGTGELLRHMDSEKWKRIGVEPSEHARIKIDPSITTYPSIQSVNEKFQVISLWHVMEHLHDPEETMLFINEHLADDGTLFIAVPNLESADAKHYGDYWAAYDTPRHLCHFSKRTMKALLAKYGFQVETIKPMPFDAYYVSLLSEKYAHPESHFSIRAIKAFYRGLISNLRAGKDNYSSLLYIAAR